MKVHDIRNGVRKCEKVVDFFFFRKRESGAIVGGGAAPRGGVLDVEKPRHDRTSIPLLRGARSPRRVTARVNVPD